MAHRRVRHQQHQRHPLLEVEYDEAHRAHALSEEGRELQPLRPRTHMMTLDWDERYAPYIRRAGFIEIVRTVLAGLPALNPQLLTAAVDRWRPETHTFHLPAGEMTITLQDVKVILCLTLGGLPVTGVLDSDGWRERVQQFCGHLPPEEGTSKKVSGVTSMWLRDRFGTLPPNSNEATAERFARVWLWNFLGSFLFPDASGNNISWMFVDILNQPWENIAGYSWGSAVLAWTYRQLCEACRRTSTAGNLGGCAYLLQVWIWERCPIGRPGGLDMAIRDAMPVWYAPDCLPSAIFAWSGTAQVIWRAVRKYKEYINDLDLLTQFQVIWEPWEDEHLYGYLSYSCWQETGEYRNNVPLIFFHVVEMHLPIRVCRQFGRKSGCPPPLYSTNPLLHSYDRRKRYAERDWRITHHQWIELWENRGETPVDDGEPHDQQEYDKYLQWLHRSTRVHLLQPVPDHPIGEDSEEEAVQDEYDQMTRLGTQVQKAPMQIYVAQELTRLSNEAAIELDKSHRHGPGGLHAFVDKIRKTCKKLAQKMSCVDTPWLPPDSYVRSGTASGSVRTPAAASSQPATGATSSARTPRTPFSDRAGKGPMSHDYDESETQEQDDFDSESEREEQGYDFDWYQQPGSSYQEGSSQGRGQAPQPPLYQATAATSAWDWGTPGSSYQEGSSYQDWGTLAGASRTGWSPWLHQETPAYQLGMAEEIRTSQLAGAPLGTQGEEQGVQQQRRHHRHRDRADVPFSGNMVPTRPKRTRRPRNTFTPADY